MIHVSRSFTKSLFISVGGIYVLLALCFAIYQYHREKTYKVDVMQSRLQMYNYELVHSLDDSLLDSARFVKFVDSHRIEGMRVTIIDKSGKVLLDSNESASKMGNHKNRREVADAIRTGNGYDVKRASETLSKTYFYSATYFADLGVVVRAAVPYSVRLTKGLEVDRTYLYYSACITVLFGLVLYRSTNRVGRHVRYLRRFAMKAEQGKPLDKELQMELPDDELGDISHTIIVLYWKLKHSEEDKVRLKRQLTQNAAHELKTPAASIQGYLETIMNTPDLSAEKRNHFLERCYAQSVRMSKLLLDMSALTKLDEANGERLSEQVDVARVVRNAIDDVQLQLTEKKIKVNLNLPDGVKIIGDTSLIYSIFRNLLDNALAYATGATWINIVCFEEEDVYDFSVADNGVGVEPQHLAHLFERFYRVDKGRSRKQGGTGLGMAIVKNAVLLHGGNVEAELTPGGGLTVNFSLKKPGNILSL